MKRSSKLTPLLALLMFFAAFTLNAAPDRAGAAMTTEYGIPAARTAEGNVVINAAPAPPQATPRGEQKLTIAGPSTAIPTLDPALVRDSTSAFLVRQIFSGLVQFDKDLKPTLALADRVVISADGLRYSFELSSGAQFQDGTSILASDVAYSLNRSVSPVTVGVDLAALGGPTFLANIKGYADVASGAGTELSGVTLVDERDLTIELSTPDSAFLMKLASNPASVVDKRDVARGGDWSFHPNGSGPFTLSTYLAQDHLTLTPNRHFVDGAPALQTVNVLLGSHALNPFNLYQVSGVDIADVGLSGVDRVLAPDAGYVDQLRTTPLFSLNFIAFDPNQAPMNDPEIRKAVALAFPSAKVAGVTLNGHATAATGVIPDGMLGQTWPSMVQPIDVAAAKVAIAKSSYGSADRVPPIMIYLSQGGVGEALRDSLAETVGLKVEVISMEWPDFVAGLAAKSLPGFELYWTADFPDPESILAVLFGTGRPDNYLNYANPKMDGLLTQAAAEINPVKRAALYQQAQQLLIDDHVVIPILFDVGYTLVNPAVKGLTITSMGIISLDSVWMEH